ncbi:hypothetical protein RI367_007726 [Sorochytrium milnesiophthora]
MADATPGEEIQPLLPLQAAGIVPIAAANDGNDDDNSSSGGYLDNDEDDAIRAFERFLIENPGYVAKTVAYDVSAIVSSCLVSLRLDTGHPHSFTVALAPLMFACSVYTACNQDLRAGPLAFLLVVLTGLAADVAIGCGYVAVCWGLLEASLMRTPPATTPTWQINRHVQQGWTTLRLAQGVLLFARITGGISIPWPVVFLPVHLLGAGAVLFIVFQSNASHTWDVMLLLVCFGLPYASVELVVAKISSGMPTVSFMSCMIPLWTWFWLVSCFLGCASLGCAIDHWLQGVVLPHGGQLQPQDAAGLVPLPADFTAQLDQVAKAAEGSAIAA